MASSSPPFVPALIVVDFQEDFCPPSGSLAISQGRDIAPAVNELLALPSWAVRIATQDWHPADHISFAANHTPPKQPFVDSTTVVNPRNASETYDTRLWPVHCVQGTPGADLVPELAADRVDVVVKKGTDARVEMYSAFYDPFESPRVSDSGLARALRDRAVTHVYVVGLAFDYCVSATAVDAAKEGFVTYVVEEGTRAVDAAGWDKCKEGLTGGGVKVVSMDGEEVQRLRAQA
ncbi:putative pyrazinamidase nicotinamidase [Diaporthe ampelina]|uniref:nicotinamidase n=1 Tax=Diaporthe ampelina TaxID=1214573 RepID=A0A0G2FEN7_9PEZI|nr:putative pyrazinamidase nicotinamidase [Diaporthe ampelina]